MYAKMIKSAVGNMGGGQSKNTRVPQWANGLIVIGSIALVGAVGWFLYKKYKDKQDKKSSEAVVESTKSELEQLQNQGQKLNYPQSAFESCANFVEKTFQGCDGMAFFSSPWGNETDAIFKIINVVKSKADWLNLVKTFGVRKIDNCGGIGSEMYDLPTLINQQADESGGISVDLPNYKAGWKWYADSKEILQNYLRTIGVVL